MQMGKIQMLDKNEVIRKLKTNVQQLTATIERHQIFTACGIWQREKNNQVIYSSITHWQESLM